MTNHDNKGGMTDRSQGRPKKKGRSVEPACPLGSVGNGQQHGAKKGKKVLTDDFDDVGGVGVKAGSEDALHIDRFLAIDGATRSRRLQLRKLFLGGLGEALHPNIEARGGDMAKATFFHLG